MVELACFIICLPFFIGVLIVTVYVAGFSIALVFKIAELTLELFGKGCYAVGDGLWALANWQYDLLAKFVVFLFS